MRRSGIPAGEQFAKAKWRRKKLVREAKKEKRERKLTGDLMPA
jgi:hypothetical protein